MKLIQTSNSVKIYDKNLMFFDVIRFSSITLDYISVEKPTHRLSKITSEVKPPKTRSTTSLCIRAFEHEEKNPDLF